jgi:fluoride exporter
VWPGGALLGVVALGGALGSLGRWAVGVAAPHQAGGFPWDTLGVNVSGAFAAGMLTAFLVARPGAHRLAGPFVGVGLLGGWTTFSAFAVDVVALTSAGREPVAAAYLAATLVLGVGAVPAGMRAVQRLRTGRPASPTRSNAP